MLMTCTAVSHQEGDQYALASVIIVSIYIQSVYPKSLTTQYVVS